MSQNHQKQQKKQQEQINNSQNCNHNITDSTQNTNSNVTNKPQINLKNKQNSKKNQAQGYNQLNQKQRHSALFVEKQEVQPLPFLQQVNPHILIIEQQKFQQNIIANNNTYYTLFNGQNIFKVNSRIKQFSEFLKHNEAQMDLENELQDEKAQNIQIQIPAFIHVTQQQVEILEKFINALKKGQNQIILTKIKNYDKDLSKHVAPDVLKFIKENLSSLSHEDIKNLLKICDFLRIKLLTELIHLYLSSKYAVPLSKSDLDALFLANNVPNYSRKDIINLKKEYFWFFKSLYSQNFASSHSSNNKNNEN